jgi:chromosome segregation ATPase
MPAKKKQKSDRQTMLELTEALSLVTQEWREAKEKVAQAEALLKSGKATMMEHAKVVTELSEALAARDKELGMYARALAAIDGERTFLWEEIDRFRNRLLDFIRWEMLLPESARVELNKVRAQDFADQLDDDASEATS